MASRSWQRPASSSVISILDLLYLYIQIFKFVINIWILYYFNYFLLLFNIYFLKNIFKILLTWLPTKQLRWYIPEKVGKELLQISLLLLTRRHNYIYIMLVIYYLYRWIYRWTNKNIDCITYGFSVGNILNLPIEIPIEWNISFFLACFVRL